VVAIRDGTTVTMQPSPPQIASTPGSSLDLAAVAVAGASCDSAESVHHTIACVGMKARRTITGCRTFHGNAHEGTDTSIGNAGIIGASPQTITVISIVAHLARDAGVAWGTIANNDSGGVITIAMARTGQLVAEGVRDTNPQAFMTARGALTDGVHLLDDAHLALFTWRGDTGVRGATPGPVTVIVGGAVYAIEAVIAHEALANTAIGVTGSMIPATCNDTAALVNACAVVRNCARYALTNGHFVVFDAMGVGFWARVAVTNGPNG